PIIKKLNYDPFLSFEPVCKLVDSPMFIVVNRAAPYRAITDLIDAAQSRPGALTFAGAGPGGAAHLGIEMFKRVTKSELTFVPFPGAAPALNALLGDHVVAALVEYPTVVEHIKSGRLRALAAATTTRIGSFPDLPTVAESGYPGFEVPLWYSLFAPAK